MLVRLNPLSGILRSAGFIFLACLALQTTAQTSAEPKDATGWFQRASDQMNLRVFGAAPFHMKVAFTALPGLELLDKKKKLQIIAGDGVYEETWLAPHHWRREVTLGDYHAVEVESDAGRKIQASSDYEPSRVLMLLDALLYPIQRDRISPDLDRSHAHWSIEHKTAGGLSYVLVSAEADENSYKPAYIFLPSGLLVQSNEYGLAASWQDDASFAGRVVPRRLTIQAGGQTLLTADIAVQAADGVDSASFELPGGAAEPGMTLRPLHNFEVRDPKGFGGCTFIDDVESPVLPLAVRQVVDRHGVVREVELLDSRNLEAKAHSNGVASLLDCLRSQRLQPASIDKSPAELAWFYFFRLRNSRK